MAWEARARAGETSGRACRSAGSRCAIRDRRVRDEPQHVGRLRAPRALKDAARGPSGAQRGDGCEGGAKPNDRRAIAVPRRAPSRALGAAAAVGRGRGLPARASIPSRRGAPLAHGEAMDAAT